MKMCKSLLPVSVALLVSLPWFPAFAGATCQMEGDAFEMEDQRNWTDASYKTYVRPLALPWGYTLAKGSRHEQSVRLSFTGGGSGAGGARVSGSVAIVLGQGLPFRMPELGVARSVLWLANLTAEPLTIRVGGVTELRLQASVLDSCVFEKAAASLDSLDAYKHPLEATELDLDAYAVARVEVDNTAP